jgi:hypothetical protein
MEPKPARSSKFVVDCAIPFVQRPRASGELQVEASTKLDRPSISRHRLMK